MSQFFILLLLLTFTHQSHAIRCDLVHRPLKGAKLSTTVPQAPTAKLTAIRLGQDDKEWRRMVQPFSGGFAVVKGHDEIEIYQTFGKFEMVNVFKADVGAANESGTRLRITDLQMATPNSALVTMTEVPLKGEILKDTEEYNPLWYSAVMQAGKEAEIFSGGYVKTSPIPQLPKLVGFREGEYAYAIHDGNLLQVTFQGKDEIGTFSYEVSRLPERITRIDKGTAQVELASNKGYKHQQDDFILLNFAEARTEIAAQRRDRVKGEQERRAKWKRAKWMRSQGLVEASKKKEQLPEKEEERRDEEEQDIDGFDPRRDEESVLFENIDRVISGSHGRNSYFDITGANDGLARIYVVEGSEVSKGGVTEWTPRLQFAHDLKGQVIDVREEPELQTVTILTENYSKDKDASEFLLNQLIDTHLETFRFPGIHKLGDPLLEKPEVGGHRSIGIVTDARKGTVQVHTYKFEGFYSTASVTLNENIKSMIFNGEGYLIETVSNVYYIAEPKSPTKPILGTH